MIKEIATDYTTSHLAFTDFPSVWDYQEDSKRGWQWTWNATEPSALLSEAHMRCNCFHNWPRTARKCIDQQWHWADIAISLTKALLRRCHEKNLIWKKTPKFYRWLVQLCSEASGILRTLSDLSSWEQENLSQEISKSLRIKTCQQSQGPLITLFLRRR